MRQRVDGSELGQVLGIVLHGEQHYVVALSHQLIQDASEPSTHAIDGGRDGMTVHGYFHGM